jgi:hypothetical protein
MGHVILNRQSFFLLHFCFLSCDNHKRVVLEVETDQDKQAIEESYAMSSTSFPQKQVLPAHSTIGDLLRDKRLL